MFRAQKPQTYRLVYIQFRPKVINWSWWIHHFRPKRVNLGYVKYKKTHLFIFSLFIHSVHDTHNVLSRAIYVQQSQQTRIQKNVERARIGLMDTNGFDLRSFSGDRRATALQCSVVSIEWPAVGHTTSVRWSFVRPTRTQVQSTEEALLHWTAANEPTSPVNVSRQPGVRPTANRR